jgi:hypothetical protein
MTETEARKHELCYISTEEAYKQAITWFRAKGDQEKEAFLLGYYIGKHGGHRDTYMLCALAKRFPTELTKENGSKVVDISEIVWDDEFSNWDTRNEQIQDRLLDLADEEKLEYAAERQLIARMAGQNTGVNVIHAYYSKRF